MAQPFFPEGCKKLKAELKKYLGCVVLSDYDGTLTRIVRDPDRALLPKSMRRLLKRLAEQKGVHLGILSGRRLSELRRLVGLSGIFYAGNHGLEIGSRRRRAIPEQAKMARPLIRRLAIQLSKKLKSIPGTWVENKGYTLTVHYRKCRGRDVPLVLFTCDEVVRFWRLNKEIRVIHGKKVYELRPAISWDKGRAVAWLLKNLPTTARKALPVYLGDDATDEDAFRAVREMGGWAIRVGAHARKTKASHVLRGIGEVQRFFRFLLRELHESWNVYEQKSRFVSTPAST